MKSLLPGIFFLCMVFGTAGAQEAPDPAIMSRARDILRGGGTLAALHGRITSLAGDDATVATRAALAMMAARIDLVSGDYIAATETLRPFKKDPDCALTLSLLALATGDDPLLKETLLPLLADPSSPWWPRARLVLALQLYRSGDNDGVLQLLAKDSQDLGFFLKALACRQEGRNAESHAHLAKILRTGESGGWLTGLDGKIPAGMDPLPVLLFGLGDVQELAEEANLALSSEQEEGDTLPAGKGHVIQVGVFKDGANARTLVARLVKGGFDAQSVSRPSGGGFRVLVMTGEGEDPQKVLLALKDKGIDGFLVR